MKNNIIPAAIMVIFIFLSNVAIAESIPINRPWHDEWWERTQYPYIVDLTLTYPVYVSLGTVYTPLMKEPIENLQLDRVAALRINGTAREKIIEAKTNAGMYSEENRHLEECYENCFLLPDAFSKAICFVENSLNDLGRALDEGRLGFFCGLHLPSLALFELREKWQSTMDASMDALEESQEITYKTADIARKQYGKLEYAGACEQTYSYEGSEECRKMKTAFDIVDSGQQEATYGQINILKSDIVKLNAQLIENANTSLYPTIMTMAWGENGIIATFSKLEHEGKLAMDKAHSRYRTAAAETSDNKFYAEQIYEKAENQMLDKIREAIETEGFEAGKIGTIAERWATLKDRKQEADEHYKNAKNAYEHKVKKYLLVGISGMQKANANYIIIKNESENIIADAEKIVSDKRLEASAKIEETKNLIRGMGYGEQKINEKLKAANDAFAAGESASALGEKYEKYTNALRLAAGAAPTKSSEYEKDYLASLAELEELLNKAEKDSVSVSDLEAELEFIKNTRPENELDLLAQIKEELAVRIETRFYALDDKRKELVEKLKAANATDLLAEMQEAERGIVGSDGRIDWLAAAGSLKTLNEKYDDIADRLEQDVERMNDALANQLITETSLIIGRVKIDEPTEIKYVVNIENPKPYEGNELTVKIPLDGEFRLNYADIKDGSEGVLGVQTDSKTMKITLERIKGFERKTIIFEKGVILAATRSYEAKAKGLGGGAAMVNEKRVFQLSVSNAYVDSKGKTNALVDGADPARMLSEGIHTLTTEYVDNNAYSEERMAAEVTKENGKTKMRHSIIVRPFINLDEVPIMVDISGSGISDATISCGTSRCIKQQAGQNYLVVLQDVKKGGFATISVSWTINNVSQFAEGEIARYENSTEPGIRQIAQEAKTLLAAGDETSALKKIDEMKRASATLENEKAKLLREYYDMTRKIRNELEDLKSAIEKAQELGLNASETSRFMTRHDMLDETLKQNALTDGDTKEEIEEKLDELKSIDANWLKKEVSAIAKKATKDFENYKKQLNGVEEAQYQLGVVEDSINALLSTERATDAVQLLYELERLEQLESSILADKKAGLEALGQEFDALRSVAEELLSKYETEYKDAKIVGQGSLFSLAPEKVKGTISNIESYIKAENSKKADYIIRNEFAKQIETMNQTLRMLQANAARKISEMKAALEVKSSELSAEQLETASKKTEEAERLLNAKSYVKAMAKAAETVNYINSLKGNMNTVMYLIVASVFLIAIIAFFLYSKQKKKGCGLMLSLKKEEPEGR